MTEFSVMSKCVSLLHAFNPQCLKQNVVLICDTKVIYRGVTILLAFCSGND